MSPSFCRSCHVLFYFCSHQRDKWETGGRGRKPRGWCPHVIATPSTQPLLPSLALDLCPPSFRLPEWQLAAGRVQRARQPPSLHTLANGLEKTRPGACGVTLCGAHRPLIITHGAWRPLKHASLRPQEMNPVGHTWGWGHTIKIRHLIRGPFSRSLKNNYMWSDGKFWWTFPIRKIKKAKNGIASVFAAALLLLSVL